MDGRVLSGRVWRSPSFGVPQEVGGRVQIGDSGHTCVDMKSHQRSTEHRERCLAARERGWVPGAQGQTDIVWGSSHHAGPERRRAERAGARSHFAIELFFAICWAWLAAEGRQDSEGTASRGAQEGARGSVAGRGQGTFSYLFSTIRIEISQDSWNSRCINACRDRR